MISVWINDEDLNKYKQGIETAGYSTKIDDECTIQLLVPVSAVIKTIDCGSFYQINVIKYFY